MDKHKQKDKSEEDETEQPTYGTYVPKEARAEVQRLGRILCERGNTACGVKPIKPPDFRSENSYSIRNQQPNTQNTKQTSSSTNSGKISYSKNVPRNYKIVEINGKYYRCSNC